MNPLQISPVCRSVSVVLKTKALPIMLPMVAVVLVETNASDGKICRHLASVVLTSKNGLRIIDETDHEFNGHHYDT
jgi:hypothetical protein